MWRKVLAFLVIVNLIKIFANGIYQENEDFLYPDNPVNDDFDTMCYEELGCFSTGPPWYDPKYRPISVVPVDDIAIRYLLFTRENQGKEYSLIKTTESLKHSNFSKNNPTVLLIHDYIPGNYAHFMPTKDELLKNGSYNVIVLDWTHDAGPPIFQAIANARVIAAKVAKMLEFLQVSGGLEYKSIHIVGHGLGAHMAGYIGERIKDIGRISGLDPYGVYFHHAPPEVTLDPSDADFVSSIISNGGSDFQTGIGLNETTGHANFYPNSGNHQPGCSGSDTSGKPTRNMCSHNRSLEYFQYSINSCSYLAHGVIRFCADGSNCESRQATNHMGFHANKLMEGSQDEQVYVLTTTAKEPYC